MAAIVLEESESTKYRFCVERVKLPNFYRWSHLVKILNGKQTYNPILIKSLGMYRLNGEGGNLQTRIHKENITPVNGFQTVDTLD